MSKALVIIGLFFGVVIFFRMRNERLEREAKERDNAKEDIEE